MKAHIDLHLPQEVMYFRAFTLREIWTASRETQARVCGGISLVLFAKHVSECTVDAMWMWSDDGLNFIDKITQRTARLRKNYKKLNWLHVLLRLLHSSYGALRQALRSSKLEILEFHRCSLCTRSSGVRYPVSEAPPDFTIQEQFSN